LLNVEATFRVIVLCTAVVPLIVCEDGFNEQVTYATGLEQENVIGPVKPIAGAAETVTLPEAPGAIDTASVLSVSVSGFVTPSIRAALVDPPKFPVALYVAVIVSDPTVLDVVVNVAVPLVSVAVPSEVVPLRKVTLPLGTPAPEATIAVRISFAPIAMVPEARLRVVVVGIVVTVTVVIGLVEAALFESPTY
jgi:hypothetical protein